MLLDYMYRPFSSHDLIATVLPSIGNETYSIGSVEYASERCDANYITECQKRSSSMIRIFVSIRVETYRSDIAILCNKMAVTLFMNPIIKPPDEKGLQLYV